MTSCFFLGHRDTPLSILPQIRTAIEYHILTHGVTIFYVGHYGAFDRMVTQALTEMKTRFPHIHLYRVIPYHPSVRAVAVPPLFDGTYYPPQMEHVPPRYAIIHANRAMIDHANYIIAYCVHSLGNTHSFIRYANQKGKTVTLLTQ